MTVTEDGDDDDARELLWWLGAQTPVIPPHETRGMTVIRRVTGDEWSQYAADSRLLRQISNFSLFRPSSDATEQLQQLAQRLAQGGPRFLSEREKSQVARALVQARKAMGELPRRVSDGMAGRSLPLEGVADELMSVQRSDAFLRLQQSAQLPLVQIVVAVEGEIHELVLPPSSVVRWARGTGLDRRVGVGILSMVESAQVETNRVAARWLVAQEQAIREASLRINALAAEVIEGSPCLIGAASEQELSGFNGKFTFDDMPFAELRGLQEAILRGKSLLNSSEREPATKGPRGMTAEQVLAALSDQLPPVPAKTGDDEEGEGSKEHARQAASPLMASDPAALLAHAEKAAYGLEEAWSTALQEPARRRLVADWRTMIASVEAQLVSPEDRDFEVPPPISAIAQLALQPDTQQVADAKRAAVRLRIDEMQRILSDLEQPSMVANNSVHGERRFFSSGAFAMLRSRNRRLAELTGLGRAPSVGLAHLRRAQLAAQHADAEAVLLHCTGALAAAVPDLSALGEDSLAVVGLGWEAVRQLADGQCPDEAVLILLSHSLLQVVTGLVGQ